jgi:hypothetical protein
LKSSCEELFRPSDDVAWLDHAPVFRDFRDEVKEGLVAPQPCVVLLVSPPGAGKSRFADDVALTMRESLGLQKAFVDGSDDELVDTALSEVLSREVPPSSKDRFLIVDEFHMLAPSHKNALFTWLAEHGRRLHVLLIANRTDSSDDDLLTRLHTIGSGIPKDRVTSVKTRLVPKIVKEVQDATNTKNKWGLKVWYHCTRALFGGEAVSLRSMRALDEAIGAKQRDRLSDLLSAKMPRLSILTVDQFVRAFLDAMSTSKHSVTETVKQVAMGSVTPVGLMLQCALLTLEHDVGHDFPDFVSTRLSGASDIPPAFKIATWCAHMRCVALKHEKDGLDAMSPTPAVLFGCTFVDQVGFPLLLGDGAPPTVKLGYSLSWAGAYDSLHDLTDAVKRGHSVNWNDVHEQHWADNDVSDLHGFVKLLSACRSPGKVLRAIRPDNLVGLLKSAMVADTERLAYFVVQAKLPLQSTDSSPHCPFETAVWVWLMATEGVLTTDEVLDFVGRKELFESLAWSSVSLSGRRSTRAEPHSRGTLVRNLLLVLSRMKEAEDEHVHVPRLWRGMFASQLPIDDPIAAAVAIYADDENPKWPPIVRAMFRLAHLRVLQADLDLLFPEKVPHPLLLREPNHKRSLHNTFATGLARAPTSISLGHDLQRLLIQADSEVLQVGAEECRSIVERLHPIISSERSQKNKTDVCLRPAMLRDALKKAMGVEGRVPIPAPEARSEDHE